MAGISIARKVSNPYFKRSIGADILRNSNKISRTIILIYFSFEFVVEFE